MHIGFITPEYPHPKVKQAAGIATSIKNLVVVLVSKGVNVTVFVYHQNKSEVFKDEDVEIHLIPSKKYKLFTWYLYRKHIQNYINLVVDKKEIDILEAPDWTGITAFMRLKAPLFIRFHGSDAYFCKLENRKQKFKNFMFEKLALKRAAAYIAPTDFAGSLTQKIFDLKKEDIKTIHNGLSLENFKNESPEIFKRNNILYIGTIIRKKGVLELAKIFNKVIAENPGAKLILIGGDSSDIETGESSTYKLMEKIFSDEAKKQVNYLGKIPYKEVRKHIKNAHICTFPSFAETLGMVTIESMAMQKPVVNTNIGWANELIDDGVNGYLVHPEDIELYTEKLLELINDDKLCLKFGKAARQKVETFFDINKNADINIDYYKSI
ncbi:glycosyltransferase family 4 protein [Algibacter amylolyticus]|uniref:Glycosyltransferase family 4 protein n=1 Tax=Algibacter amylolyticus TaxID=1608400 RepID=A0A5M7B594_9FLAO|nr:glycosyltransferase family 4 protein [Algibacter amylolyticus]KAA5822431.1 glycosyltransferase family 4 protein [Algibacter amylolyticus]MBB5269153.1 glycosyltransferase involved in cell wall biosynthesis [Algibacter amylolyticus]TSJ73581.1 glycosyltransferase family 4 protein [Algibacter amylolyticus]